MTKVSKRRQVQHGRGQAVQKRQLQRKNVLQQGTQAVKGPRSNAAKSKNIKQKDGTHVNKQFAKVPFGKHDNVLLIGEGDFSFALCLSLHHPVESIVATSFDSRQTLDVKYPHAEYNISKLSSETITSSDEDSGMTSPEDDGPDTMSTDGEHQGTPEHTKAPTLSILHSIDATKLSTTHRKALKLNGLFDKIVFNFPHIGGLSTDVNRQTRANQKLIRDFFTSAKPLLKSPGHQPRSTQQNYRQTTRGQHEHDTDEDESDYDEDVPGQIIVTLFDGEAYADWNIRDIARSVGLKVVESFRFPWEAYPEYQHARTIGEIRTGQDRSSEGKRKGAWRGEERPARSFIFEVKEEYGDVEVRNNYGKKDKKKARRHSSDDDSD